MHLVIVSASFCTAYEFFIKFIKDFFSFPFSISDQQVGKTYVQSSIVNSKMHSVHEVKE